MKLERIRRSFWATGLVVFLFLGGDRAIRAGFGQEIPREAIESLLAVGSSGQGNEDAQRRWKEVAAVSLEQIPQLFEFFDGANPIAANWLDLAIQTALDRERATFAPDGEAVPINETTAGDSNSIGENETRKTNFLRRTEAFALDSSQNPTGRKIALRLLQEYSPELAKSASATLLNDPCGEMRFDAIADELEQIAAAEAKDAPPESILSRYERLYAVVVDYRQLLAIVESLCRLNPERYRFASACGFISDWRVVGPFDNSNSTGFDRAFEPEEIDWRSISETEIDSSTFQGKDGDVAWKEIRTDDSLANLDFNQILTDERDVLAYAAATVRFNEAGKYSFRIASENAIKIWVDGRLIGSAEIYHGQEEPDQYIFETDVVAGNSVILVKVCQNNQPQSYAGVWRMRLRVCDSVGRPFVVDSNR